MLPVVAACAHRGLWGGQKGSYCIFFFFFFLVFLILLSFSIWLLNTKNEKPPSLDSVGFSCNSIFFFFVLLSLVCVGN